MKIHDSGMPDESYWNTLFDIERIVTWLAIPENALVAEIGAGYGTFTVPIASVSREVIAFDIDPAMVEVTLRNLANSGRSNVKCVVRDVLAEGTGLASESVDVVVLFNVLHFHERRIMLHEASRLLKAGGVAAIIHFRKDIPTPRGPAVELRPDLATILCAAEGLPLDIHGSDKVLEPYHWGIQLLKRR